MECLDCNRPLRPRGTPASAAPGTLKAQPGPRCAVCYRKAPKRGYTRATECKDCHRPLRPTGTRLEDAPGTVVHRGHGQCSSCWRAAAGISKYRRDTRPANCKECDVPMRPNHSDPARYPGTIRHSGHGKCARCVAAERQAAKVAARPPKPEPAPKPAPAPKAKEAPAPKPVPEPARKPEPVVTDPATLRFIEERRERRRKAERIQAARVAQEAARARFLQSRRAA